MSLLTTLPNFISTTAAVDANEDFTILWILLSGILVFFMQAGFTLVESGMTRAKNAANIAMKNFMDISVGTISFWALGYGLMYGGKDASGFFSVSDLWFNPGAGAHDVFFQTVFAATAATIVSGAVAGRTKYSTYIIFTLFLTAIIYPISGGWQWYGDGAWLADLGFIDFAGSSIVHSVGGWAALVAAWMVGPRIGKYVNGKAVAIPGSNLLLGTLGVLILWLGWFGFNGGSVLSADPELTSLTLVTTCLAAAAGGVGAFAFSQILYKNFDLTMFLNGILGGLVGITAGADQMSPTDAILIGIIAGIIIVLAVALVDKLRLDDPVGAVAVHLICGIWGTLAVGIFGAMASVEQFFTQLTGVAVVGAFCLSTSFIILFTLKKTMGLRVSEKEEIEGLDSAEHGMSAYPDYRMNDH